MLSFICRSYSLRQIYTFGPPLERLTPPPVCLSERNEFRLMREEEKVTLRVYVIIFLQEPQKTKREETVEGLNKLRLKQPLGIA